MNISKVFKVLPAAYEGATVIQKDKLVSVAIENEKMKRHVLRGTRRGGTPSLLSSESTKVRTMQQKAYLQGGGAVLDALHHE
jgi:hypothetical protein